MTFQRSLLARAPNAARLLPRMKPALQPRVQYTTSSFGPIHRGKPILANEEKNPTTAFSLLSTRSSSSSAEPASSDLTLYTCKSGGAFKPRIVLEELGLQYSALTMDTPGLDRTGLQGMDWLFDMHSDARLPALTDGNVQMFTAGAITLYLSNRYDPSHLITFPHGTPEYYTMQSWYMFQAERNRLRYFWNRKKQEGDARQFTKGSERLLAWLEARLSKTEWLAGDKYTIADIHSFGWVRGQFEEPANDMTSFPAVKEWVEKIDSRKAVQIAREAQARLGDSSSSDGGDGQGE